MVAMFKLLRRILNSQQQPKAKLGTSAETRKRLVILGSGWGGYSLLRTVDKKVFDVICITPRNHFLFTPLLASTTVG